MSKKAFIKPEISIVTLDVADILTTKVPLPLTASGYQLKWHQTTIICYHNQS